jgi:hypothetical protein
MQDSTNVNISPPAPKLQHKSEGYPKQKQRIIEADTLTVAESPELHAAGTPALPS